MADDVTTEEELLRHATCQALCVHFYCDRRYSICRANRRGEMASTLDAGNQALKDAQYVRARECYNTLLNSPVLLPAGHPLHAYSLASLGSLELLIGNEPKAELLFVQARQILEANKLQTLPQYAQILADLGIVKSNRGQWFESRTVTVNRSPYSRRQLGPRRRRQPSGGSLFGAGRTEDALRLFDEAIAIQRQKLPEEVTGLALQSGGPGKQLADAGTSRSSRDDSSGSLGDEPETSGRLIL